MRRPPVVWFLRAALKSGATVDLGSTRCVKADTAIRTADKRIRLRGFTPVSSGGFLRGVEASIYPDFSGFATRRTAT